MVFLRAQRHEDGGQGQLAAQVQAEVALAVHQIRTLPVFSLILHRKTSIAEDNLPLKTINMELQLNKIHFKRKLASTSKLVPHRLLIK